MNVWDVLAQGCAPGKSIRTTLLGDVPYVEVDGKLQSVIPPRLQSEAKRRGFTIEAAFWRDSSYLVRRE